MSHDTTYTTASYHGKIAICRNSRLSTEAKGAGESSTFLVVYVTFQLKGEQNATIVSEAIPFLEYDLHRQLMYKLKLMGMNAAFGLKFQLSISESLIVGVASATAVRENHPRT